MGLSLILLAGCQKDDTFTTNEQKLVRVNAYINNDDTRVTYNDTGSKIELNWKNDPQNKEAFSVLDGTLKTFTQIEGNSFEGPELSEGNHYAYYPATAYTTDGFNINFSNQTGNLTENLFLMRGYTTDGQNFDFDHMTAVIKPTFRIDGKDVNVNNQTITKIVLFGVNNAVNMDGNNSIYVSCNSLKNIYIHLPAKDKTLADRTICGMDDEINLLVYIDDTPYSGKITVPAGKSIDCGQVYYLGIKLYDVCKLPAAGQSNWWNVMSRVGTSTPNIQFIVNSTNHGSTSKLGDNAYVKVNGSTVEIHTAAPVFILDENCKYLFDPNSSHNHTNVQYLKQVDFTNCIASEVTDISNLFLNCINLTSVIWGDQFDTGKVTDMNRLFYGCENLQSIDMSSFNTSNVTDMGYMFFGCKKLTSLDLSNFITSKNTNMSCMFYGCETLSSINLSSFDTSNVTALSGTFQNCSSLTEIDLKNFHTPNLKSTSTMFNGCTSLKKIDIRNLDIHNLKPGGMFDGGTAYGMLKNVGTNLSTQIYVSSAAKERFEGDLKTSVSAGNQVTYIVP